MKDEPMGDVVKEPRMKDPNATQQFLGEKGGWDSVSIEMSDVQGLWGGRIVRVLGSGQTLVRRIDRTMHERRYEIAAPPDEVRRLLGLFLEVDFLTIRPEERPGIPDEARPSITLMNASGARRTVSKWVGVADDRFDRVYAAIMEFERFAAQHEPAYVGPYRTID